MKRTKKYNSIKYLSYNLLTSINIIMQAETLCASNVPLEQDGIAGHYAPAPADQNAPIEYQRHVLVIEDNTLIMKISRSLLRKRHHHVDCAFNTDEALEFYKNKTDQGRLYNLILADAEMIGSNENGIDFVRHVREYNKETPIIVCSWNEEYEQEALEAGANGFILKPVKPIKLNTMLNAIIL